MSQNEDFMMDTDNKIRILSSLMSLESSDDVISNQNHLFEKDGIFVTFASLPNGKNIRLLKTLLTSACEKNCNYCPFRAGRNFKRATLKPDEMANKFMALIRAGIVEGIFLSSGVAGGGIKTQDRLNKTAEILRVKHKFRGYIHLKIMPGAEYSQVEHAMLLADRLSTNLEAPNSLRLHKLAPHKVFLEELLKPLEWIEKIRKSIPPHLSWNQRWPSSTTQFVVGPAGESDLELLNTTDYLTKSYHLSRAYFMAFNPINDTPFENIAPTSHKRQLRLYQAAYLLKVYGFSIRDFNFDSKNKLPLESDPKTSWARENLLSKPIEVNKAVDLELLRIPGIGPRGAKAIISARRIHKISTIEDLRKIGINPTKAEPYILLNGKRPSHQLNFWW
jgi:predicted DNA-binding helix-hairpin-helix protein